MALTIRKLRRRKHNDSLQKCTQLSRHDVFKYLRQSRRNRDSPVASNNRGSKPLWHWDDIGQPPTCRKRTPSNKVPKNYSKQLQNYLPVKQWKHTIGIISTIRGQLQKQPANKARPEGNRIQ